MKYIPVDQKSPDCYFYYVFKDTDLNTLAAFRYKKDLIRWINTEYKNGKGCLSQIKIFKQGNINDVENWQQSVDINKLIN